MKDGCVFCNYGGPSPIIERYDDALVFEPLRPVVPGHVLVVPLAHAADFADDPEITAVAFRRAGQFVQEAQRRCGAFDANLITSKGPSASQTLHVHILPRRWGDLVRLPWANPNTPPQITRLTPGSQAIAITDSIVRSVH